MIPVPINSRGWPWEPMPMAAGRLASVSLLTCAQRALDLSHNDDVVRNAATCAAVPGSRALKAGVAVLSRSNMSPIGALAIMALSHPSKKVRGTRGASWQYDHDDQPLASSRSGKRVHGGKWGGRKPSRICRGIVGIPASVDGTSLPRRASAKASFGCRLGD